MNDREWNFINSKGMPINTVCEVMQKGGKVSIAGYYQGKYQSGICLMEKVSDSSYKFTNTFLLKVEKWRLL